MTTEDNGRLLASSSLFSGLDAKVLATLGERAVRQSFEKGRTLFYQGDPGDTLYVVAEGLMKVWVSSHDGSEMVMATLRPPDAFGELSAVDGHVRSASATTLEPTVLLSLDRTTLLDAVHRNAAVADALLRALGGLARRITEQASDLVFLDLAGRVAKCLVHLAVREGHVDGETTVLELPLSQTEIAEMVGGSRQSVNQTMKSFEMRGYLQLRGREVVILDLASLQRRAER